MKRMCKRLIVVLPVLLMTAALPLSAQNPPQR